MAYIDSDPSKRWPRGEIPWRFDKSLSSRDRTHIEGHLMWLTKQTSGSSSLRFPMRHAAKDYIVFKKGSPCSSKRGRHGGPQTVNCNQYHERGVFLHELLHALGFIHEHQRPDRDQFVNYDDDGRKKAKKSKSQYEIVAGGTLHGEYDDRSVMHYDNLDFMWKKSGTRNYPYMSPGDLAALNRFYSKNAEMYHAYDNGDGEVRLWRLDHGLPWLHDDILMARDIPAPKLAFGKSASQVRGFSGVVANVAVSDGLPTIRVLFRDDRNRGSLPHFEKWRADSDSPAAIGMPWDLMTTAAVGSGLAPSLVSTQPKALLT